MGGGCVLARRNGSPAPPGDESAWLLIRIPAGCCGCTPRWASLGIAPGNPGASSGVARRFHLLGGVGAPAPGLALCGQMGTGAFNGPPAPPGDGIALATPKNPCGMPRTPIEVGDLRNRTRQPRRGFFRSSPEILPSPGRGGFDAGARGGFPSGGEALAELPRGGKRTV